MAIQKFRRRRVVKIIAAVLAVMIVFLAVWSFLIEPNRLVVKEETLELANWPAEFSDFKIAIFSDLHVGSSFIDANKLQLLVTKVNEAQPDLIVILGDFMVSPRLGTVIEPEIIAANLQGLRARHGVYAVLGNHDWWYNGRRVQAALVGVGIRDLEDDVARIERNGQAIWLAGLKDIWTNRPDVEGTLRKVTDESPVIAMTHNPDLFVRIPSRVILTLAGHTHGGQINLPLVGRIRVPSEFGQRYAAGHVLENEHHLFVTSGVGTSIIPVRFRVPPEIVILTLKAKALN
jgi:uncharacterized protein